MPEPPSRRAFLRSAAVAGASCSLPALVRYSVEAATYFRQGREQFRRGELRAALISLTTAIELDPTDEEALDLRSVVFEALDDHEGAIKDRNTIITLDPSVQNFLMRGVFALGHHPASAISDFSEVIRREPLHVDAYLFRAFAFEEQGEFGFALADLVTNARLDPENAEWLAEDMDRVRRLLRRG